MESIKFSKSYWRSLVVSMMWFWKVDEMGISMLSGIRIDLNFFSTFLSRPFVLKSCRYKLFFRGKNVNIEPYTASISM